MTAVAHRFPLVGRDPLFWSGPGPFLPQDLDWVVTYGDVLAREPAQVGITGSRQDLARRSATVGWIVHTPNTAWLWSRLTDLVQRVNREHWNFALDGIEAMQYTVYQGAASGHYTWHMDKDESLLDPQRKLSLVVHLSDPTEYEGGGFEVFNGQPYPVAAARGLAVLFPSWVQHRVLPVTRGTRRTLVAWAVGPMFH